MQIVRTIGWVLLLFSLLAFSFFNWKPVEVQIWSNLVLETKLPALVVVSFLLGLIPMWLVHRASKWRATCPSCKTGSLPSRLLKRANPSKPS